MEDQYSRHSNLDADGDASLDYDDEGVSEWEDGLPDFYDLVPLTLSLIPHDLATAFIISPEPYRALRATDSLSSFQPDNNSDKIRPPPQDTATTLLIDDDIEPEPKKSTNLDTTEEDDSALGTDDSADDQSSPRAFKKPRLAWTSYLHNRFVDVVSRLGVKDAVPKTIMQMMNVDGLNREKVASHLQKYRHYLKRQSREGPALPDQFFPNEPYPHLRKKHLQRPVMPMVNSSSDHPVDSQHHFNTKQQHQNQKSD